MCAPLIVGLLGTAISAGGAIAQGKQDEALANAQAKAYEQQAISDAQSTAFEKSRERHKQDLISASARARVGASGVAFQGSPTEALVANAGQGELDLQALNYSSQLRQNGLRTQADISRYQGAQAKQASMINAANGIFSGLRSVKFGGSIFGSGDDAWAGLR